jgi:hypothetical protein
MIPKLDRENAKQALDRLSRVKPDVKPDWGQLRGDQLIPHLIASFEMSMGRGRQLPYQGNWVMRHIVFPIATTGLIKIPKNVKFKSKAGNVEPPLITEGGLQRLGEIMEEFIAGEKAGTLKTTLHPAFGDIGAGGWAKLHTMHLDHHLKQFRL